MYTYEVYMVYNLTYEVREAEAKSKKMLINKLGEFGLIKRYRKLIKTDASVIVGSGDDCAVIKFNKTHHLLFTCDMILEDVDFTRRDNPYLIGRKAIAVSISDIAACAGRPRYCLVSMGVPLKATLKYLDALVKGMLDTCRRYKINLVGGDLSRADCVTIDVSMLGEVEKKNLVLRSGAKEADVIFVSGNLGGSLRGKHLKFTPRLKEARYLAKNFKINAMIDISDGLLQDLGHILEASGKGAVIYEDLIPMSKDARDLKDALYSGEDFELLFTMGPAEARKLYRAGIGNFRPIGGIKKQGYGLKLIDERGRQRPIKIEGFRHF